MPKDRRPERSRTKQKASPTLRGRENAGTKQPRSATRPKHPRAARGSSLADARITESSRADSSLEPKKRKSPADCPTRPERKPEGVQVRLEKRHVDWDDEPTTAPPDPLVARWLERGKALLSRLAEHGVDRHEYRADLASGRFLWIAPDGRVSAEAKASVICSFAVSTGFLAMAWADPMTQASGIERIPSMPNQRDGVDEETAWRVAMETAEAASAEYLYRVVAPHACYFLALRDLSFSPEKSRFTPSPPVRLVLTALVETRQAVESGEPAGVIRMRLSSLGKELLRQADYTYRETDWVARLTRTGKRVSHLAQHMARPTYNSVAAGLVAEEWLDAPAATELCRALDLLTDEWSAFA